MRERAKKIRQFQHDELKKHGSDLRKELLLSVKAAAGADRSLSGVGNKPKLGVTLRTVRGGSTTTVTLKPSPKAARGQWTWMESGTKAGPRAHRYALREQRISDRLAVSRRSTQTTYRHPGTSGKRAWSEPVDRELPKIRVELRSAFSAMSR